jgi:hypothetical protein
MMAKITKGHSFGGAVRYVMQDKKEAKLLDSRGVLANDKQSIINSFRLQCQLRPDVKVMVGHISLDFSVEDVDKMSDDFMVKVAQDYLQRMNILNTQYIIARHYDRKHPHCHIIFNRIGNNGKLISDRNDRIRSAKICRTLSEKYQLHIANGKDHVHRERLRGADAVKYQIYDALEAAVQRCRTWEELRALLAHQGITLSFTHRGTTSDIQGVVFEKDGLRFNGSKIDRKYSYSKISTALKQNEMHQRRGSVNGDSEYEDYKDHETHSQRRSSNSRISEALHEQPYGSDTFSGVHIGVSAASSFVTDVASGIVSATGAIASGMANAMAATPSSPSISSGGGGGNNSSEDLADDEYIDEYGVRRKKHRGMHR